MTSPEWWPETVLEALQRIRREEEAAEREAEQREAQQRARRPGTDGRTRHRTRRHQGAGWKGYPADVEPPPMHRAGAHVAGLRAFVDTCVLVAAVGDADPDRRTLARGILGPDAYLKVVTSAPVLVEFHRTVRALPTPVEEDIATTLVRQLARDADVVALTAADVVAALALTTSRMAADLSSGEMLRMRDALVVRAAQVARCDVLVTRAFPDGTRFDGLLVEDPFAIEAE
jgi:predicted nucleic acid-binding protein